MRFLGLLLILGLAPAQSPEMTNRDVTEMTKAGLSTSVILAKISSSPCRFDTSVAALANLKSAGVDDSVDSVQTPVRQRTINPMYVWIEANEEWIAASRATVVASSPVATSSGKTTVQTHSEFADVAPELSGDKCGGVVITNNLSDADYAITIERYNAGHLLTQRNSFSVFRARDGNLLLSNTTTRLKNAVNDICRAILKDVVIVEAPDNRRKP